MSTGNGPMEPEENHKEPSEAYFQELGQIQQIIEREANNSFKIKGWTITLVVVVILFRAEDHQILLRFIPLISFWYLDSYYLKQERKFRRLYDWVRSNRINNNKYFFDMNPSRFSKDTDSIFNIMKSKAQLIFYGMIVFLLVVVFITSLFINGNSSDIYQILNGIFGN